MFRIGIALLLIGVHCSVTTAAKVGTDNAATQSSAENAPNMAEYVKRLAAQPKTINSVRQIAKAFEICSIFDGPDERSGFFSALQSDIPANDPLANTRLQVANLLYDRCETLIDKGRADLPAERVRWLKVAASLGDVAAKLALRQVEMPKPDQIPAFHAELKMALNSSDADAIWEAGRSAVWAGIGWAHLTGHAFPASKNGKPMDGLQAVLQLAACQLGRHCGKDSVLMQLYCIRGKCNVASYAASLSTFMDSEQIAAVQAELPRVLKALRAKQGSRLLFKK